MLSPSPPRRLNMRCSFFSEIALGAASVRSLVVLGILAYSPISAASFTGIGGVWTSIGTPDTTHSGDSHGNRLVSYRETLHFDVQDLSVGAATAAANSGSYLMME